MINKPLHIFPKGQVTSNKNAHNFWHHFQTRVLMLYHFVWSILPRVFKPLSHWLTFFNSQLETSILRFLKLTLRTKWITPCERAWTTAPKSSVGNCVHFCLRSLGHLERCDPICSCVSSGLGNTASQSQLFFKMFN